MWPGRDLCAPTCIPGKCPAHDSPDGLPPGHGQVPVGSGLVDGDGGALDEAAVASLGGSLATSHRAAPCTQAQGGTGLSVPKPQLELDRMAEVLRAPPGSCRKVLKPQLPLKIWGVVIS